MYLRLAWRNLWRNKRRTLIAASSVLFAVVLAVATRSMQLGSYEHMIETAASFQTGYLQLQAPGYWEKRSVNRSFALSDSLMQDVRDVPEVSAAAPRLELFALLSSGAQTRGARILGMDPAAERDVTGMHRRIEKGRYLEPGGRGMLLGGELADQLGVQIGDTVVVIGQGYHGMSATGLFPVVGTVNLPSAGMGASAAWIPLAAAQELSGAYGRATAVAVMVPGQERVQPAVQALKQRFREGYRVMDWREMMPELVQAIEADNVSGIIMLAVIYLVIAFGIFGTVLMMTMERTRELAMMIAVGMKRVRLRIVLIAESLLLTFTGVVVGLLLSVPVLLYLKANPIELSGEAARQMAEMGFDPVLPFSLDPQIFLWQGLTVLAIALVVSLYPVFRIARIRPVDELRA